MANRGKIRGSTGPPNGPTKRGGNRGSFEKPVLKATGPCQVWSCYADIFSKWQGKVFKVYSTMEIFSREIVGWRAEERESDRLAVEMFEAAIARYGAPQTVHADSGPAMRSNLLRDTLIAHGVEITHNRPYVSNDNPFRVTF